MRTIDHDLKDILLCAAYSGNGWDLEEFQQDLINGIEFIKTIQELKQNQPEEYKALQQEYFNRWNI
jgi:hypothetical protein